jgi:hypothetical protein
MTLQAIEVIIKPAVNVRIGSSECNKVVYVELCGEMVHIDRIGTNSSVEKTALIASLELPASVAGVELIPNRVDATGSGADRWTR